MSPVFIVFTNA